MLGVIANETEERVVREFFELFKTPWEFYRADGKCDVLLCCGTAPTLSDTGAKLVLVFAGDKTDFDAEWNIQIDAQCTGVDLSLSGRPLPIYGNALTFKQGVDVLIDARSGKPAAVTARSGETIFVRVGYDLFHEVQSLLTEGQPSQNAAIPALDLHIEFLRDLITSGGVPLVEIPPVPDGFPFMVCLTHDLDHASIRRHKLDSTIAGFLYRSIFGSVINLARGRFTLRKLLVNWVAAVKLPLVHVGLAKDIWFEFDRYLDLEGERPSTFFVIPVENHPGLTSNGPAPRARGTRYDVSHIAEKITCLIAANCEIGLHGIDAWLESSKGREEARRISAVSKKPVLGVRMHWLYRDEKSPGVLEEAGFCYDSTVGYNDTCGYRAGTSQVFKHPNVGRLLELPMHIMDTALFYPSYLNLSETEAAERLSSVFDDMIRYGGALTVNWHDRSIAAERLWGDFYVRLLDELTIRGACFSTAGQAVSWFRRRRSAVFEQVTCGNKNKRIHVAVDDEEGMLGFRLRYHHPRSLSSLGRIDTRWYTDTPFTSSIEFHYPE